MGSTLGTDGGGEGQSASGSATQKIKAEPDDDRRIRRAWKRAAEDAMYRNPRLDLNGLWKVMQNPITDEVCSNLPKKHMCREIGHAAHRKFSRDTSRPVLRLAAAV